MPSTYDVIVLGLGVMGSAAAFHVAKDGARVLGIEQFALDHRMGSSYGESRIIRYAYRRPAYIEMAEKSFALWRDLEEASGKRLMFRTGGLDFGAADAPELIGTRDALAAKHIPFEWLNAQDAANRFPQFRFEDGMMALYQADAAYLNASGCVRTLAEQAGQHGAEFRFELPVTGITPLHDSVQVHTVGGTFEAGRLIITAGAWAGRLLAGVGLALPLQPTREQLVYFTPAEPALFQPERCPVFIMHSAPWFYGIPNVDGTGVKIAVHCNGESVDPDRAKRTVDADYVARVQAFAARHVPLAAAGQVSASRVCLYTMTPDEDFIIDRHPAYPHIAFGAGFSGHGFKFGTLIGQILADLALKGATPHQIGAFRAGRFTAG